MLLHKLLKPKTESISILFLGDTYFGESYQVLEPEKGRTNILAEKGYEYSFENFEEILEESDLVIANLETPITDLTDSPYKESKRYIHYSNPDFAPQTLSKFNIDIVSLANNHIMDFGPQGLFDTIEHLEKNSIKHTGAGYNEAEALKPILKTFAIQDRTFVLALVSGFEYREGYEKKYQFYAKGEKPGVLNLGSGNVLSMIENIRTQNPDAFIVIFPHWGDNYKWKNSKQTELAQRFINLGVDLIIGHGAHTLQEIEKIDNGLVIYNLGNFVFNSPGRYASSETPSYSLISRLIVTSDDLELRLYPIHSNNLETGYQPNFMSEKEFNEIEYLLKEKNHNLKMQTGKDKYGYFFALSH